jgi:hypothetical protein
MSKTDEHVERAKELILKNKRTTSHKVPNMLGISFGSVQIVLKENLNMHSIVTKSIPRTCSLFVCTLISAYNEMTVIPHPH